MGWRHLKMGEVSFEYGGVEWETGTWMDKIKCPITGCSGNAKSVSGMKCHLNMRHDIDEVIEVECQKCGSPFPHNLSNRDPGKYCSIECANTSR